MQCRIQHLIRSQIAIRTQPVAARLSVGALNKLILGRFGRCRGGNIVVVVVVDGTGRGWSTGVAVVVAVTWQDGVDGFVNWSKPPDANARYRQDDDHGDNARPRAAGSTFLFDPSTPGAG